MGGAFVGLDKVVHGRIGKKMLGFGAEIKSPKEVSAAEILLNLIPEDLIKYGLIPEFVGRIPVIAVLEELDREALIKILTEPKNALLKQYSKIFSFEEVELEFTGDAIKEIANKSFERESGARGLRAVMEKLMVDLMYDVPSQENIAKIIITKEVVTEGKSPELIYRTEEKSA